MSAAEHNRAVIAEIGGQRFEWGSRTYVMGIVNVTPDSFSGDGLGADLDAAIEQGLRMVREGADMLDIGGESTRPGHEPVTAAEEIQRVDGVVRALAADAGVPISIDRSEEHTAELQSPVHLVCRLLLGKKKKTRMTDIT